MNSNSPSETFMEKLNRKVSSEPLVPIGCLATVAFLGAGLRAFNQGQAGRSQMLMRGRVLAQGFTVFVMMAGAGLLGWKKPHDRPATYEEKFNRDEAKRNPPTP